MSQDGAIIATLGILALCLRFEEVIRAAKDGSRDASLRLRLS